MGAPRQTLVWGLPPPGERKGLTEPTDIRQSAGAHHFWGPQHFRELHQFRGPTTLGGPLVMFKQKKIRAHTAAKIPFV